MADAEPGATESPTTALEAQKQSIDLARLRLERQKLAVEVRLKRRELSSRGRKTIWDLLANPLILAIVGGFLTLLTSLITNYLGTASSREADDRRAKLTREAELRALQSDLIKTFIKAPDTGTVRSNLGFLVEVGLLPDYEERLTNYLKDATKVAPRLTDGQPVSAYPPCPPAWARAPSSAPSSSSSVGLSLHVATNRLDSSRYAGWEGQLQSPATDAKAMAKLAQKRGFSIQLLVDNYARSDCVLGAIASASKVLKDGDVFLVTMSGHGGQVPDTTGTEPDKQRETWALYDRQVTDEDLYQAISRFSQGVRVVVVTDTSHGVALRRPAKGSELQGRLLVISGAREDQLAMDGKDNGAFTEMLLNVWSDGKFSGSYKALFDAIAKRMPRTQTPMLYEYGAGPSLASERAFSVDR